MDPLNYDGYTSYSDSSAPRTPSPREEYLQPSAASYKDANVDETAVVQNLFASDSEDSASGAVVPDYYTHMPPPRQQVSPPLAQPNLLQQLYEDSPAAPAHEWQHPQQMARRATYPYAARHEPRAEASQYYQHPQHQQQAYPEQGYPHQYRCPPSYYDAPSPPDEHHHGGVVVPTQSSHYHHQQHHLPPPMPQMPHPPAVYHPSIPVQHTDDAASKETQYLRRRCFNCHTTEPPSWRRSTLNPGKIVCNKCGLYERTHLRPRPLRFDELRAGSKVRKQQTRPSAVASAAGSGGAVGKKHAEAPSGISRRSSVSSNGGSSDWDDNVSVNSSSSGGYSPSLGSSTLSLSRSNSHSPPQHHADYLGSDPLSGDENIRLPSAGLSANGRKKSNSLPIYPSAPSWSGSESRLDAPLEEPLSSSPPMLASMVKLEA